MCQRASCCGVKHHVKNQKYLAEAGWESLTRLSCSSVTGCSFAKDGADRDPVPGPVAMPGVGAVSPLGVGGLLWGCRQPTDPLVALRNTKGDKNFPPPTPTASFFTSCVSDPPQDGCKRQRIGTGGLKNSSTVATLRAPTRGEAHGRGGGTHDREGDPAAEAPSRTLRPPFPPGARSRVGAKLAWVQPS